MFDQLETRYQSILKKITFTASFVDHLKKRKISSVIIEKKCKVSRKHSKEVILSCDTVKKVKQVEECYKKNEARLLSEKYKKFYKMSADIDGDTVNGLIDGYKYFYSFFLKKENIRFEMACPICEREVSLEWDHVIPKSKYPLGSLIPINLVPICHYCNHNKLAKFNFTNELPFHPLYQKIDLKKEIIISLNSCEMKKELGTGLDISYKNNKFKNLVKLYKLDDLISSRVTDELRVFINDIKNETDDKKLDIQKRYNPENNFGKIGDIKLITDEFIQKLSVEDLAFLTTKPALQYFNLR